MARAKTTKTPTRPERSLALTVVLYVVVIIQTLLATWAFTHFGADRVPDVSVPRFPPYGAEGVFVLAAFAAICGSLVLRWRRWAAYALLGTIGLELLVLWRLPIQIADLPENLYATAYGVIAITGAAAWYLLNPVWRYLERA